MTNLERYLSASVKSSKFVTKEFSTSFSLGIKCLGKDIRSYVYSIYGFVRVADEIVDTFFDSNQEILLDEYLWMYLYYYLNNNSEIFPKLWKGGGQKNIDINEFKKLYIEIPTLNIQLKKIDEILKIKNDNIELENKIKNNDNLMKEIMQSTYQ